MTGKRYYLLAIGFILSVVPLLAYAAHTACGTPEETSKKKCIEKTYVVSKDGCTIVAPEHSGAMMPSLTMESCCGGRCMQLGRNSCMNPGPMHRSMFIEGAGHMMNPCGGPHGGGSCMEGMLALEEELTLNEIQKNRLREIKHAVALAMIDLETELAKEQLTLEKLLGDEAGLEEIARQLENVSDAEYDLKLKRISSEREAMEVLTKEQREILKAHKPAQEFKWINVDESSCPKEIEVNVEEGDKPGERKVIIIKESDTETDD